MSGRVNIRFIICIFITSLALLLLAGCANDQRAVELYVDAMMHNELGENEQAVEKLNTAVGMNRRFSPAYSLLGEVYEKLKEYDKSAASYEKATKLNPWSFKDYFNLGRIYQIMKRFAEAIKAYENAIRINPEYRDTYINTAQSYYELKDYDNALMSASQAEQLDPDSSEIQKILGDIYESRKDHEQAVTSYKRALEIDSNDVDIMTSLAVTYLRAGRSEAAEELLNLVIQINPYDNNAYKHLGYCYLQLRQPFAEEYKVLQQTSKDPAAMALLEGKMNRLLDKSLMGYESAIGINDEDWDAHRGLGVALLLKAINAKEQMEKDSLKTEAVEHWHRSLDIKPDQPSREKLLKYIRMYSK